MKPVNVAEHNHHHHGLHSPTPASATKISIPVSSGEAALFGKGRYKVWALAAIALLALWSMFAASVTLRLSSGELAATFGDASDPLIDDSIPFVDYMGDCLQDESSLCEEKVGGNCQEMEQREKLVRRMWDVYTRTDNHVRLPRFWQEAFEAAYEELAGDDTLATDAAISEIARMSIHRPEVEQSWNKN